MHLLIVALRALLRNKMRSFLTALGVVIGVGAVIAMTAIGAGARARVDETFASMGSNMLVISSGAGRQGGARSSAGSQPTLTWGDLEALQSQVPSVKRAAPVLSKGAQAVAEGQNWATSVQGITPDYLVIRQWDIALGEGITDEDVASNARVALLGQTVVDNLYGPYVDPTGQILRVSNVPFEIIGVVEPKGQSAFGSDYDDVVFIPVSTWRSRIEGGLSQFINGRIYVGTASQEATVAAEADITELLRQRHRIREDQPEDFSVRNLSDMAAAQQEGAETMTALLAGIAFVSLVVGGIGIMNIMLVSVTERTREIGLRMAVGARPRDILTQFLAEAVVLSIVGGGVGVAAGLAAARALVARFDWPMLVQPGIVALALGFSAAVGVGFGLYPALKASRLDPIQALKVE